MDGIESLGSTSIGERIGRGRHLSPAALYPLVRSRIAAARYRHEPRKEVLPPLELRRLRFSGSPECVSRTIVPSLSGISSIAVDEPGGS